MKKINNLILKKNNSKIVSLTAYSYNIAKILDKHCDLILVGDSLGSVLYNYSSTREVSLDTMIEHSKSVRKGIKKSIMVVDMPFGTYKTKLLALKNAKLIMKKTKCDAVKLEGGEKILPVIKSLIKNKIPVMGHLGILPQTEKKFTFKGKQKNESKRIIKDAKLLESAGVFSIVLECVEGNLSKKITNLINIPTIGIGSSNHCDGQVLVTDDLLGLNQTNFKFIKKYVDLNKIINKSILNYKLDVKSKKFPKSKQSFFKKI